MSQNILHSIGQEIANKITGELNELIKTHFDQILDTAISENPLTPETLKELTNTNGQIPTIDQYRAALDLYESNIKNAVLDNIRIDIISNIDMPPEPEPSEPEPENITKHLTQDEIDQINEYADTHSAIKIAEKTGILLDDILQHLEKDDTPPKPKPKPVKFTKSEINEICEYIDNGYTVEEIVECMSENKTDEHAAAIRVLATERLSQLESQNND